MHIHQTISLAEDDCAAEILSIIKKAYVAERGGANLNTLSAEAEHNMQQMVNEAFELGRKAGRAEFGHG